MFATDGTSYLRIGFERGGDAAEAEEGCKAESEQRGSARPDLAKPYTKVGASIGLRDA